jgi:catalase
MRTRALIKERPISTGFANSTFNGLNAFPFVKSDGTVVPVRWSFMPVRSAVGEAEAQHPARAAELLAAVKRFQES